MAASADGLEFTESRPLGGTWALDALWSRLGIGRKMRKLLQGRRRDESAERVLFALTANRALAPSSKLAAARWVNENVLVTGLPVTSDDACYRAMGRLLEIRDQLERKVFDNLADLLSLEVGLLFFVTAGGLLRSDAGKAKAKENLDGKCLLRTSDPTMSAEDIAPATSSSWKSSAAGAT
jgi:hypothetical protein